jgi:hypothetical protein
MAHNPTGPATWDHGPLERFANVDNTTTGFTELRTHGVSGPPASSVLQYPIEVVTLVEGNADSGFWRRWRLGGHLQDVPHRHHIEAFSWGGLTSRAALQALWLLLLPFSLVNIAHWMLPPYTNNASKPAAWAAVALLRVLALSFTVTLALAGAEITMDLGAWQCGALAGCRENLGPWSLIAKVGDRTGLRLAIGGAVLSLVLVLLLVAGAKRFRPLRHSDRVPSPLVKRFIKGEGSADGGSDPVLAHPAFWAVDQSTRWLRALHAVAWCCVIGAVATGALSAMTEGRAGHSTAVGLLVANICALALIFLAVIPQYFGRGGKGPWVTTGYRWVNAGAVVLLAASLGATWRYMPNGAEATEPVLPWVQGAMGRLALAQLAVLYLLTVCVLWLTSGARRGPAPPAGYRPMLDGLLAPVVAFLGWILGLTFSAGLGLWVADRLQGAVSSGTTLQLISPPMYEWIGVGVLAVLLAVIIWLLFIGVRVLRQTKVTTKYIQAQFRGDDVSGRREHPAVAREKTARARSAARVWILAQSVETIPWMIAGVAAVGLAVAELAAVAPVLERADVQGHFPLTGWWGHLPSIGAWVVTTGTALMLLIAYTAFRNRSTRRIVGILWDVTTFWPRANHPLTPACSAERAVPQLADRIAALTRQESDSLVLSAHSQGSILGAAAILRLQQDPVHSDRLPRVALLTYGSPLRRLYARAFPAYFSDQVLEHVRDNLGGRWLNLWAHTDPIGASIALPDPHSAMRPAPKQELDWLMLPDPLTLGVDPRTGEPVGVCDHSGYLTRPEYPQAVERARQSIRAGVPTSPSGQAGNKVVLRTSPGHSSQPDGPVTAAPVEPAEGRKGLKNWFLRHQSLTALGSVVLMQILLLGVFYGFATSGPPPPATETALAAEARLSVKDVASTVPYPRDTFGSLSKRHNGCDTRNVILRHDLENPEPKVGCAVLTGTLDPDPYTGIIIQFISGPGNGVDIDHLVALADAWRTGAATWLPAERLAFGIDPRNLLAVDASSNRRKRDQDAASWLPSNKAYDCTYVAKQVAVKLDYGLWVTPKEGAAMIRVLDSCPSEPLPRRSPLPTVAVSPGG